MKIAQVAPLWESVPPKAYGGTELVVWLLCEELAKLGHEVTLFASGDSKLPDSSSARLISTIDKPMRECGIKMGDPAVQLLEGELISKVLAKAKEFDVIHNHVGYPLVPFSKMTYTPMVTTLHGSLQFETLCESLSHHKDHPFISISNYQRKPIPDLNYVANIYHGIHNQKYVADFDTKNDSYLAFLGRMSPEKGPLRAIEVAKATGKKLIMAAKVDAIDEKYFKTEVLPHIDNQQICFIGEVNHEQKNELFKNAFATLCPVDWPEPFGLVLIESMACGTPVLAFRNGSIPEIITDGVSGFISDSIDEMIKHVKDVETLSRKACRMYCEKQFSAERMARDYERVYRNLMAENSHRAISVNFQKPQAKVLVAQGI